MVNDSERQLRELYEIKMGDAPEVIEEKINKYYFRYYKVTDAEYTVVLLLIKSMLSEAIKSKNTKLALKYVKAWYKIRSLFNKRRRRGVMVKDIEPSNDKYSRR